MTEPWSFEYRPLPTWRSDDDGAGTDVVVALRRSTSLLVVAAALEPHCGAVTIEPVLERRPIFWARVRSERPIDRAEAFRRLAAAKVPVRYVASTLRPSYVLPPRLAVRGAPRATPSSWSARRPFEFEEQDSPHRWFLGPLGIGVDRRHTGHGEGARLAVVDDEAAAAELLELDQLVLVNLGATPRSTLHGATLVALATSSRKSMSGNARFIGVAPHASPRLYCIPKPGTDVLSLPLAIARAVDDGADVIVCATYVEGNTSPMLDDALEFARSVGRAGRGTAVVLPVGRETSNPEGSVHASLTLSLRDPASDPRAFCIGPSGRDGGWFVWRDQRGKLRPFGNRGPAVRWLAPGDDLGHPFIFDGRWMHSESSGASALAGGALLLVLAVNPDLKLSELDAIVTSTAAKVPSDVVRAPSDLADPHDAMPAARDPDGHDPKHGYGRIDARCACMAAGDPVAAALLTLGEDDAAAAYFDRIITGEWTPYSRRLGRWLARVAASDRGAQHALRVMTRHARLVANEPSRTAAHGEGATLRLMAIALRLVTRPQVRPAPKAKVALELDGLLTDLERCSRSREDVRSFEENVHSALAVLWPRKTIPTHCADAADRAGADAIHGREGKDATEHGQIGGRHPGAGGQPARLPEGHVHPKDSGVS